MPHMSRTALPYDSIQPIWQPEKAFAERSHLDRFIGYVDEQLPIALSDYESFHEWSCHNPGAFYSKLWDFWGVVGEKGRRIFVEGQTLWDTKFLPDAQVNYAENILAALERRDVIIDTDQNGQQTAYSVKDIQHLVSRLQQALKAKGIKKHSIVSYCGLANCTSLALFLATASLGAIFSFIRSTEHNETKLKKLKSIDPDIIFVSTVTITETAENSLFPGFSHFDHLTSNDVVLIQNDNDREQFMRFKSALSDKAVTGFDDFIMPYHDRPITFYDSAFDHPLYLTYTHNEEHASIHSHGATLLEQIKEHYLHNNLKSRDNLFTFSTTDTSWFWSLGALLAGVRFITYDGPPFPDNQHMIFDLIDGFDATTAYLPTDYVSTLHQENYEPQTTHKLINLKALFAIGENTLSENDHGFIHTHIKQELWSTSIILSPDLGSAWHTANPLLVSYAGVHQGSGLCLDIAKKDDNDQMLCLTPPIKAPLRFWNDPKNKVYKEKIDNDQFFILEN